MLESENALIKKELIQRYMDNYCPICKFKVDGTRHMRSATIGGVLVAVCFDHPAPQNLIDYDQQ